MSIFIKKINMNQFQVTVTKNTITTHMVYISDKVHKRFTSDKMTKEQFLKKSFLFLLQRESNTSIMKEFNIEIIAEFFPEFTQIAKIGWIDLSG